MRRAWLAGLSALLLSACTAQAAEPELAGQWVNEAGSTMIVAQDETGRLTGRYCSELGRVDPDSCHPLIGWAVGDVVGFSVKFDPPGSITSWSGQMAEDADGPYLRTLWHLSRDVPDAQEADRMWESVINGYAVFRPVAAAPSPSPARPEAE